MKKRILKIEYCKLKTCLRRQVGDFRRGMTYVELIVVLSIFGIMTSAVLFNYGIFQAKVDIKNLASDIALKIVEAQKSAISGKLPLRTTQATWKPSYGLNFSLPAGGGDNRIFTYFADLNSNDLFDTSTCPGSGECLETISITKGNLISSLGVDQGNGLIPIVGMTLTFERPDSGVKIIPTHFFWYTPTNDPIMYAEIGVLSPKEVSARIRIYASGRIEIN